MRGRPDIFEIDWLAVFAGAERLSCQVFLHGTSECIGDNERRGSEIVGLCIGADAAFEISIAGEHSRCDQAVVVDGFGNFRRKRAGIADAGGAAKTYDVEADLIERFLQA